jgi:hypothetical protein
MKAKINYLSLDYLYFCIISTKFSFLNNSYRYLLKLLDFIFIFIILILFYFYFHLGWLDKKIIRSFIFILIFNIIIKKSILFILIDTIGTYWFYTFTLGRIFFFLLFLFLYLFLFIFFTVLVLHIFWTIAIIIADF